MRVAVIGSGPSGVACAKALIRRGLKPTIIDVGETLPPDRHLAVERMAKLSPSEWSEQDRSLVSENPTLNRGGVPKKMVFGSDFHFAHRRDFNPTVADQGLPSATFAKGGYSVAWGAAVLPTDDCDLSDWPVRRADLEASYRRVLAELPLSGARDGLEAAFPLLKNNASPLPIPDDARALMADLARLDTTSGPPFVSGQARLAVDAAACRHCGLCLSGCVYGAIYSLASEVDALAKAGSLCYRPQHFVEDIDEDDTEVRINFRDVADGTRRQDRFDYVFVAAGAIQSTRIVLASLKLYDEAVVMKDSQKFILPLLRARRTPIAWPNSLALANIFVEFKVPKLSSHWVHAQISSVNDYVLESLRIPAWTDSLRRRLLAPFYERLLIAWCGLHSDHSSHVLVSLAAAAHGGPGALQLRRKLNPEAAPAARRAARRFARVALRARTLAVLPALMIGTPGAGNHFGGTLPMRANPRNRLDTDLLGRVSAWRRTHVVDGAILPSIPATTVALLQMANADRIAAAAELH